MSAESSVSDWIAGVKLGDERAAAEIFARYFERLMHLARQKLGGAASAMADEEDVAVSALARFCRGARSGRFPGLVDRDGLWRLLVKIVVDKAIDQRRRASAEIRGGGRRPVQTSDIVGHEPTPELAAMLAENVRTLLARLEDLELQATAMAKLEGFTNREIAAKLDCALRTVERRLMIIRERWSRGPS